MAALFFVPVVIVSALAVEQGRAFWPSVAVGGVAMFASMGAVMALLSFLAGSDIVSAISQMTRQMFDMSGALGDSLLSMMMQLGLITAQDGSSLSMTALDSATREQLVSSIVMMMDSVLRLEIPMQMATGSVAAGVLGQAVLRRGLLSRGDKEDYPPAAHVDGSKRLGPRAGHHPGGAVSAGDACAAGFLEHVLCIQRRL